MKIEYYSELEVRFHTVSNKGRRFELVKPFLFSVDDESFEVPVCFWTDFASIPRFIWPIINPYEIGKGPIPHDFGYYSGLKDKEYWDRVLYACMEYEGITSWKLSPVYKAVSWFGSFTWEKYRKQGATVNQLLKVKERRL